MELTVKIEQGDDLWIEYTLLERSTAEHVASMTPLQRLLLAAYLRWLLETIETNPKGAVQG